MRFPLVCAGGCADLLNAVPLYTLDRLETLPVSLYTLYMTTESADEVAQIVSLAKEALGGNATSAEQAVKGGFTRGMNVL